MLPVLRQFLLLSVVVVAIVVVAVFSVVVFVVVVVEMVDVVDVVVSVRVSRCRGTAGGCQWAVSLQ